MSSQAPGWWINDERSMSALMELQTEEGWAEDEESETLSPRTDEVPKLWHVPGPKLVNVYLANQPLEAFSLSTAVFHPRQRKGSLSLHRRNLRLRGSLKLSI